MGVAGEVSPAARRLRRADEQQLEVARVALGRGRFVVVVAAAADWPLVVEALGVEPVGEAGWRPTTT